MKRLLSFVIILCLSTSACSYHAFSPPARTLPLESARTIDVNKTALASSASIHKFGLSDGGATAATIAVKHGVADRLELQGEIVGAVLRNTSEFQTSELAGAGRVGAKFAPLRHIAATVGIGAGASPVGTFVSPDVGVIGSFENRFVVPFVAIRAGFSQPIFAHELHGISSEGETLVVEKPNLTKYLSVSTGARIPLQHRDEYTSSVLVGIGGENVSDTETDLVIGQAAIGVEVVF